MRDIYRLNVDEVDAVIFNVQTVTQRLSSTRRTPRNFNVYVIAFDFR